MNRLVAVGLAVVALLLGEATVVSAANEYWEDKAPDDSSSSGSGSKAAKTLKSKRKSRASRAPQADYEDQESGRRVWTETDGARVKSIHDDQGNLVYQKAWDKRTGKEVPAPEAGREPQGESSRDLNLREPTDGRSSRPRRGEDGDYEESRSDPRPQYKTHKLHQYGPRPGRHPYEFSLHLGFWSNDLSGSIKGTGGVEGKLKTDTRSTMQGDFHNAKAGGSYTQLHHRTESTTAFVFKGTAYAVGAIYQEDIALFDGFYRWGLWQSPDSWVDWLLGLKVLKVDASVTQGTTSSSFSSTVPLPELGLIMQHSLLDNIKIRGFAKYAYGALSGKSGTMIDAELEASYTFPGEGYSFLNQFSAGYKYTTLDFLSNKDKTDETSGTLNHVGPYVKCSAYF